VDDIGDEGYIVGVWKIGKRKKKVRWSIYRRLKK
jgi:hypothetical protein